MTPSQSRPEGAAYSGNLIGISAMIASCAAFVANDTCVKQLSESLPLGEVIFLRNASATALLVLVGFWAGALKAVPMSARAPVGWRMVGDLMATILFLAGLMSMPIGEATALAQITPLAMTAAAAILFHEPVGWRRWLATIVGLFGVLLIARPGTEAFQPAAFLILASVAFVVMRDLATRRTAGDVSTTTIAAVSMAGTTAAGLALAPFEIWSWPQGADWLFAGASGVTLAIAHMFAIVAMRHGDVATVGPFRYSLILFALLSGWLVWAEWPDNRQLAGIMIVVAAGIYTVRRERRLAAAQQREALRDF
jgi:drug/metabolite transporter (DMT)-like permease